MEETLMNETFPGPLAAAIVTTAKPLVHQILMMFTFGLLLPFSLSYLLTAARGRSGIPGPTPLPLFGNLFMFLKRGSAFHRMAALARQYGGFYALKFGPVDAVVAADAQTIREVEFNPSCTGKLPFGTSQQLSVSGHGHLYADKLMNPAWNTHRKVLHGAAFQKRLLPRVDSIIQQEAQELCNLLETHEISRQPIDITGIYEVAVTNVLLKLYFGRRLEYDDPRLLECRRTNSELVEVLSNSGLLFILPVFHHLPGPAKTSWTTIVKCQTARWTFIQDLLSDTVANMDNLKAEYGDSLPLAGKLLDTAMTEAGSEVLDQLLSVSYEETMRHKAAEGSPFSAMNIIALLMDVMLVGSDTTINSLSWLTALLVNHQHAQNRVRGELILDADKSPYLEACMKESQRLYPIYPSSSHRTIEDTTIRGYRVKKNTTIVINRFAALQDPAVWEDVDQFKPERFLNGSKNEQRNYIPFASGYRECMGQHLANKLIIGLTSPVLKKWKLEGFDDKQPDLVPDSCCQEFFRAKRFLVRLVR